MSAVAPVACQQEALREAVAKALRCSVQDRFEEAWVVNPRDCVPELPNLYFYLPGLQAARILVSEQMAC